MRAANETTSVLAIRGNGPKQTSHRANCPHCRCPTWVRIMPAEANVRVSCVHFAAIVQTGNRLAVEFSEVAG